MDITGWFTVSISQLQNYQPQWDAPRENVFKQL